jgi:hypothetical protein
MEMLKACELDNVTGIVRDDIYFVTKNENSNMGVKFVYGSPSMFISVLNLTLIFNASSTSSSEIWNWEFNIKRSILQTKQGRYPQLLFYQTITKIFPIFRNLYPKNL